MLAPGKRPLAAEINCSWHENSYPFLVNLVADVCPSLPYNIQEKMLF
ncbi:hypothetical protein [Psychrobacillus glaciei]|nr:hypothetical protein [Psychrobacillus glaciei]